MSTREQVVEVKWPSRQPVWFYWSFFAAVVFFVVSMWVQYARNWSFAEREYLGNYILASTVGRLRDSGHYQQIVYVDKRGKHYIAAENEIESGKMANGEKGYRITAEGKQAGAVQVVLEDRDLSNEWVRKTLGHVVYRDQRVWDYIEYPTYGTGVIFAALLCFALPGDIKRARIRRNGQRVRGAEMVGVKEFNWRNSSDGMGWINLDQSWVDRLLKKESTRWVRIPEEMENSHISVTGDTGAGKSAAIRAMLAQIEERGEVAIVYDPALEYLPEFYSPERGDVILNPLDARCPYWTPNDEVLHPAEALTLATSLFQDEHRENEFFVKWSREIFAHLITLKPTLEQLISWMCHPEEIDGMIKGTPIAAAINPQSANQRNGVLGSLNRVAGALQMLPKEQEAKSRWSAAAWAKERKGWIFITSKPTVRERLLPLISLWLDLLVLRLMGEEYRGAKKTWFVLDELASLQRLPQLHTALTENRKSGNPVVLGFQGRSQLEKRYGLDAETMLSQPATKIFFKTSEAGASEWISKMLGEEERAYLRETTTQDQLPKTRRSVSEHSDTSIRRLVMGSEISGLAPLHGYMKLGNLVVGLHIPYLKFPERHEKFVERKIDPPNGNSSAGSGDVPPPEPDAPSRKFFE